MTLLQVKKLSELHGKGWKSVPNPDDPEGERIGGPAFVQHPDGTVHVVHGEGSVEEYEH